MSWRATETFHQICHLDRRQAGVIAFFYHFIAPTRFCCFFQAEVGIRGFHVTGVQTCALPIFVAWLNRSGKQVDYLSDDDLERFKSGEELARDYDLVVFPGHAEYVTRHAYDVVERYRDLGCNLMFLSANNFFWRVQREGTRLVKDGLWRELGRPEAGLVGVQYVASDGGRRQAPYTVAADSWAFAGTGWAPGSVFGR